MQGSHPAPQSVSAAAGPATRRHTPLRWDVFCRVVDNFGDIGICWRLCVDLARRGHRVRLWVDDPRALGWMAPEGEPGVQVRPWVTPFPQAQPGDVVIEAFACDPPETFVAAMARAPEPPLWINLEYLSAEDWVERVHGLPSPQWHGPGAGMTKWFFHPGFTPATGGLLRESGLLRAREGFDTGAWREAHGLATAPGERLVTLFCYAQPALRELIGALGAAPTLLATTPGHATQSTSALELPRTVRQVALPWLDQTAFDRLLWSADLNFVRGEDTPVRAIWSGRPFVWQLYPQDDGAHAAKLQAFLSHWRALSGADLALAACVTSLWETWNHVSPNAAVLPDPEGFAAWARASKTFRDRLASQPDLVSQLLGFVLEARGDARAASPAPETPAG